MKTFYVRVDLALMIEAETREEALKIANKFGEDTPEIVDNYSIIKITDISG